MNCPRCVTWALIEREHCGTIVDVCPGCRGLWLDRDETEKLIGSVHRQPPQASPLPLYPSASHDGRAFDNDRHRRRKRQKNWVESLADLFD